MREIGLQGWVCAMMMNRCLFISGVFSQSWLDIVYLSTVGLLGVKCYSKKKNELKMIYRCA